MDEERVRRVLARYELGAIRSVEPLDADPARPWLVQTDCGAFVVRRCRLGSSDADLRFEHGLADWLAERGLPVARAQAAAGGGTWTEVDGERYAVFDCVSGEPFRPGERKGAQSAGACLGTLHKEASAWPGARDRQPPPSYRRARDDADALASCWPGREQVEWLVGGFRELDDGLAEEDLEEALILDDFSTGNVVFRGDEVSGIFDLECCHWGRRLLDLANSVLWFAFLETGQEGAAEHRDEFDLDCARAFVRGYEGVWPLRPRERRLLAAGVRRQVRRWALFDLVDAQRSGGWGEREWAHCRAQIELADAASHLVREF